MVESSKILTVSYGTFSCTLEGFDDSFGTMKAIAEYFRDLAADDRYFGAEPPTPDVAMLAKIAEREITRRVDARTEDGGIVLRASEAVAPAMPPQVARPDPVQVAAAAVVAPARMASTPTDTTLDDFQTALSDATAEDMEPVAGPEAEDHVSSPLVASGQAAPSGLTLDDMAPAAKPEAPAHPDSESVAAKLQRIRAVVGKAAPKVEEVDFAEDLPEAADPLVAELPAQLVADDVEDDIEYPDMADAEDAFEDVDAAEEISDAEDDAESEITTDMIAAALADADGDYVEDEEVDEMLAELSLGDDQLAEDIAEASDTHDDADVQDDDNADMLSKLQAKVAQAAKVEPEVEVEVEADTKPEVHAQVLRMRREKAQPEAEVAIEPKADKFEFTAEDDDSDEADYGFDDDAYEDEFEDDDEAADLAALDGVEEYDDIEGSNDTTLPDDEEAALLEELAEVERDFAPAAPHKARKPLPETNDATMSHILSQTDQELNEPEGNRRRNAIAQLKAAVAATEAARQLGDMGGNDKAAEDAFRGDLSEAVRPTRPSASDASARPARPSRPEAPATRTERPRPAPLKLVASQRVDAAKAEPASPVQPRRVASAAPEVTPATASNFAEFAEEMGASSLADLLEAAAAYTAFVEGSEDFSRPQIMKKVQLTTETEISREDGLRSFGTLLRQGRISKVRNGRFQVSEETRFRPESKVG